MQTHMRRRMVSRKRSRPRPTITTLHQPPGDGSDRARETAGAIISTPPPKSPSTSWSMRCGKDEPRSTPRPASSDRRNVVVPVSAQLLFARAARACDLPSPWSRPDPSETSRTTTVVDLYLSWYPAGLLIECDGHGRTRSEPAIDACRAGAVIERTLLGFAPYFPRLRGALEGAQSKVGGGWIVAPGRGTLADATSRPASARSLRRAAKRLVYFGRYRQVFDGSVARATDRRGSAGLESAHSVGWAKKNLSPKAGRGSWNPPSNF